MHHIIYRALLACMLLLFADNIAAQPVTAFVNIQNQVMAWDNGIIRKIDYLLPVEMKTGRTTIAYLDNARSFKIYYGGGTQQINIGFTNAFFTTDNLVFFRNASSVNVFDNGKVTNLTRLVNDFYIGDSLVVFQDGVRREYKAYYNGEIYPIENFLASDALQAVKVSDNIAAYDNYANQFRIFYQGNIIEQEDYAITSFDVGRNTVAYVDANNMFRIFHNNKTVVAENFPPQRYTAGDNLVAYVSTDGYFKIFYNDSVYNIGFFEPDYQVGDNLVAFRDNSGYLQVFYKGKIDRLEVQYPDKLQIQYNSLSYINQNRILRMYSFGELYDVTTAQIDDWEMNYDVLKYRIGNNMFRIFYKGEEYQ